MFETVTDDWVLILLRCRAGSVQHPAVSSRPLPLRDIDWNPRKLSQCNLELIGNLAVAMLVVLRLERQVKVPAG